MKEGYLLEDIERGNALSDEALKGLEIAGIYAEGRMNKKSLTTFFVKGVLTHHFSFFDKCSQTHWID